MFGLEQSSTILTFNLISGKLFIQMFNPIVTRVVVEILFVCRLNYKNFIDIETNDYYYFHSMHYWALLV